jgi:biopolymer transport protein ExbD
MGKNKKALSASDDVEDINISPLIDMVFILLIFFIVTTVFVEEPGIDIVKPVAYNAQDLPKNVILIGVTESDNVFYGGEEVGLSGIRVKVRRLIRRKQRIPGHYPSGC